MRKVLWFSEDNYYSQEQVEDMMESDDFGTPFISTKMTRENWTDWSRVQMCCKGACMRTFVKIDENEVKELYKKLSDRLEFLSGNRDTWK